MNMVSLPFRLLTTDLLSLDLVLLCYLNLSPAFCPAFAQLLPSLLGTGTGIGCKASVAEQIAADSLRNWLGARHQNGCR